MTFCHYSSHGGGPAVYLRLVDALVVAVLFLRAQSFAAKGQPIVGPTNPGIILGARLYAVVIRERIAPGFSRDPSCPPEK